LRWYQNDTNVGSNMILSLVSNRYPNNTNLNITKATTTKREKDAAVAVRNCIIYYWNQTKRVV